MKAPHSLFLLGWLFLNVFYTIAQDIPSYTPVNPSLSPLDIARLASDNIVDHTTFEYDYFLQPVYPDVEFIDFGKSIATGKPAVAYAVSTFYSKANQCETIEIGRTCGVKIWVNDTLVFARPGAREQPIAFTEKMYVLQERFDINLQEGENKILIKTVAPGGNDKWQILLQSENMGRYGEPDKKITASLKKYAPGIDITHWLVAGPFEDKGDGFDTPYPPETAITLHTVYQSVGNSFTWNIPRINILTGNPERGRFYDWNYHVGGFVWGLMALSRETGEEKYRNYAAEWCRYTLETIPLVEYQTKELHAVRSMNWSIAGRPMLDYTTAPSIPFIARLVYEKEFPIRDKYIEYADKILHYVMDEQYRLRDGTFAREFTKDPSVWADDMFMGIPYLLLYAEYTTDKKLRDRLYDEAVRQILQFNQYLFDKKAHLYSQACYPDKEEKIPFWSRGNGWAIWATTEVLMHLPPRHKQYNQILKIYREHIEGLISTQDAEGYWHNLLDKPETVRESSGTAIFVLAMARGIRHNWLDQERYLPVLRKGWSALKTFISDKGDLHCVKGGTNFSPDPENYARTPFVKNDTHGVLPLLFASMEMHKLQNERKIRF